AGLNWRPVPVSLQHFKVEPMQTCAYCGAENEDSARNCRECGTELAGQTCRNTPAEAVPQGPPMLNLDDIEGAFSAHDGFSRPTWLTIFKALRRYHTANRDSRHGLMSSRRGGGGENPSWGPAIGCWDRTRSSSCRHWMLKSPN